VFALFTATLPATLGSASQAMRRRSETLVFAPSGARTDGLSTGKMPRHQRGGPPLSAAQAIERDPLNPDFPLLLL
jgi:1-acyl-sn-glycerol-3-phosphate acyltransferase